MSGSAEIYLAVWFRGGLFILPPDGAGHVRCFSKRRRSRCATQSYHSPRVWALSTRGRYSGLIWRFGPGSPTFRMCSTVPRALPRRIGWGFFDEGRLVVKQSFGERAELHWLWYLIVGAVVQGVMAGLGLGIGFTSSLL